MTRSWSLIVTYHFFCCTATNSPFLSPMSQSKSWSYYFSGPQTSLNMHTPIFAMGHVSSCMPVYHYLKQENSLRSDTFLCITGCSSNWILGVTGFLGITSIICMKCFIILPNPDWNQCYSIGRVSVQLGFFWTRWTGGISIWRVD